LGKYIPDWNKRKFQCIIVGEFVRLFTAIPLLFWVGTAAVAHLAHVWALVPAAVTPVSQSLEPSLGANSDHAICSAARQLMQHDDLSRPLYSPAAITGNVQPSTRGREAHSTRFRSQILSAARLSANPPPQRA
jgi:hypothetical protein